MSNTDLISKFMKDTCDDIINSEKFRQSREIIKEAFQRTIYDIKILEIAQHNAKMKIIYNVGSENAGVTIPIPLNLKDFKGIDMCYIYDPNNSEDIHSNDKSINYYTNIVFKLKSERTALGHNNPVLRLEKTTSKEIENLRKKYDNTTYYKNGSACIIV